MGKMKKSKGFILLALLLAVLILAVFFSLYFRPKDKIKNQGSAAKKAQENLQESKKDLDQYQTKINEELKTQDSESKFNSAQY